jgi:hypothetical protein
MTKRPAIAAAQCSHILIARTPSPPERVRSVSRLVPGSACSGMRCRRRRARRVEMEGGSMSSMRGELERLWIEMSYAERGGSMSILTRQPGEKKALPRPTGSPTRSRRSRRPSRVCVVRRRLPLSRGCGTVRIGWTVAGVNCSANMPGCGGTAPPSCVLRRVGRGRAVQDGEGPRLPAG